jgi:dihydrolipoamide dehydrogenase
MSDSKKHYDVIVIGAGPAGYVAAMRSAQLGFKVACVDKWKNRAGQASLGGTYINAGCIAAMSLLESAKTYHALQHEIAAHGITVENIALDFKKMQARKEQIIFNLSEQIKQCFAYYKVDCIHGRGRLLADSRVEISSEGKTETDIFKAEHIILATGSLPMELSCAPIDNRLIIDSTATLNIEQLPKKLGIIGAGIIGLELAGIWHRLGSEVVLLDAQEHFLTTTDWQISQEAYRIYTEQGLDLRLGARVTATKKLSDSVWVEYQDKQGKHELTLDKLIVAAGRKPNSQKIAAPEAGLLLDENGFVHVDENCCTNLPGVYAIGDLTLLAPMLAHKGLEEGTFVAEYIANQHSAINYDGIPSVIYTEPEIAWVGQTEQALKSIGVPYKTGVFPFKASGRAMTAGKTEGLVKIISHTETDIILGVHIIGSLASELIAEAVIAIEFSASSEDLARTIHAHPSVSEALHEAALALDNRSLRLPPIQ